MLTIAALLLGQFPWGSDCPANTTDTKTVIRVGAYENHPKIYTDAEGRVAGFFPAILESIAESGNWEIDYVIGSWSEGLDRLSRGEIDIMPDVALSPKRQQLFDFNEETVLISWAAVYTRPAVQVQSFHDLAGKRIALLKGGIYTDGPSSIREVMKQFGIQAEYIEFDSYREVFAAISEQRSDAGVVNNIFGSYLQREFNVVQSPILFSPAQLRFAFQRKHHAASNRIEHIDRILREWKRDPQSFYHQAIDQHLYGMAQSATLINNDFSAILSPSEQEWISRHPEIRIGIDPEFYPFVFRNEKGEFDGIGADVVELLNTRLGLNMLDTPSLSWAEAVEALRTGHIDVLPCVGVTLDREEFALFTKPFIEYQRVILTRSDMPFLSGVEDLQSLKVGVQANSSHEGYLADHTNIEAEKFSSLQETLTALSAGRVDAVVGNLASASYWIRRLNLLNIKIAAPADDQLYQLHFAVRKDWPELVTILDKGLDLISPEEKQSIRNQWIAIDYKPGIAPQVAWRIGLRIAGIVLVVVLAILFWTYRLKKEITQRKRVEHMLQYRVGFERLVSETSARFIGVKPDDVNMQIQISLTEIACFTGATAACLYWFGDNGIPACSHAGGDLNRLNQCVLHPPADPPDAPWLARIKSNHPVIAYTCPPADHQPGDLINPPPPWLTTGSMVEVPCLADGAVKGFFGLIDLDGNIAIWRDEDISLLQLLSQIFCEAIRHKATEEALRNYTEDLANANQRLQELDRLKSLFIASVSHELRTPLNSIIGFSGVILKGMSGDLNARQQDQMRRVNQSAQHLLSLITDIIDISKIEAGHIDVHAQEFPLIDVLQEAIETIRPSCQAKGLMLESNIPANIVVFTDRKRIRQCVINYLSNALKYTERGHIRLEVRDWGDRVEIAVEDTGIGISPENQQRLFAPFVRLDSHLRIIAGGTGLGLYLTRKIVIEILQGAITVASEPGRGSTFSMQLPKVLEVPTASPEGITNQ